MQAGFELKLSIYFIIVLISVVLIYHFISRGKKSLALYSYLGVQALILIWAVHDMINELYLVIPQYMHMDMVLFNVIYVKSEFFVTCFIPYSWLIFCLSYSNLLQSGHKKLPFVLLVPPSFFYYLHWIDYFAGSAYTAGVQKMVFIVYAALCYTYLAAGTVIMIMNIWKSTSYLRKQTIMLSFCLILPLASSLIQNFRLHVLHLEYKVLGLDITLVSFSATLLMVAIAAFRYRFLNTTPYAMREMFNNMEQPMVFIDARNMVIEVNSSFSRIFSEWLPLKMNHTAGFLAAQFEEKVNASPDRDMILDEIKKPFASYVSGRFTLGTEPVMHFSVSVKPVFINRCDYAGKTVIFHDVTSLVNMIGELNEKNAELSAMGLDLRNSSEMGETPGTVLERDRLLHDIHDALGQSMTILNTFRQALGNFAGSTGYSVSEENQKADIGLSRREFETARQVVCGKSNKEIAAILGITEGSVRNIISKVLCKTGCQDRTQLAVFCIKNGIV